MTNGMEQTKTYLIDPTRIGFFKAILESYEDVAIMSVLDGKQGRIKLIYPTSSEMILKEIICDMERYSIRFMEVADV
jgi:hypothetical protein